MKIKNALNEIELQVQHIKEKDINERLNAYSIICAIFYRLDKIAADGGSVIANYNQYKEELLWSIESICGLDDGNKHSEDEHLVWALGAVKKLRSIHCFIVEQ